ncbi:MAG: DUF3426 domain-containing protein [Acidobacteria bacterium]|nr:DUF3426 domain-containing protein [Acidobacteriota bacterium]MBI3279031.1 DUF3426 domain-containing protein [Acidobacteriota bacterium]
MANEPDQDRSNLVIPIAVIAALLGLAAGAWWFFGRNQTQPAPPPLTPEARTYVRNLKLSGVDMKAKLNFAGAALVEITGKISNGGGRPLERVELNCVFYDTAGMVVLRERVPIVRTLLKPGDTRDFRLPFEGIPQSWNQAMPQLVIAHIKFAGGSQTRGSRRGPSASRVTSMVRNAGRPAMSSTVPWRRGRAFVKRESAPAAA